MITHPLNEIRRFRYGMLRKAGLPIYLAQALRDWHVYAIESHISYILNQLNPALLPSSWRGSDDVHHDNPTDIDTGY